MKLCMNCIASRDFPICGLRINPNPSIDCVWFSETLIGRRYVKIGMDVLF